MKTVNCNICKNVITIPIKCVNYICNPCKADLAYITRHLEDNYDETENMINRLHIRLLALREIKKNPKKSLSYILRKVNKTYHFKGE